MITSVFKMTEQSFWHHRVCPTNAHRRMYMMTLKGQSQNFTSGQGHVVTLVGQVVYDSMRLDEAKTLDISQVSNP